MIFVLTKLFKVLITLRVNGGWWSPLKSLDLTLGLRINIYVLTLCIKSNQNALMIIPKTWEQRS